MEKSIIALLTGVLVVSIIFAGCALTTPPSGPAEQLPEAPPTPPEEPPTTLPKPGWWSASSEEGTLTFIVTPDSTGINRIGLSFSRVFTCGGEQVGLIQVLMGDPDDPYDQICPITDGQFTVDWPGVSQDKVIQGQFDETGTHASGTWEISSEGTICLVVTWQASPD